MNLLEKLKQGLKQKGLDEGLATLLNVKEENEIEGAISLLSKLREEPKGFDDLLNSNKDFQSEFDRRVTKAIQKATKKIAPEEDPEEPINTTDKPDEFKAQMLKSFEALSAKLDNLEKEKTVQSKQNTAKELLKNSSLPEKLQGNWINRFDLNSETPLEDQAKALETEYEEIRQLEANSKQVSGGAPTYGKGQDGSTYEEMKEMLG